METLFTRCLKMRPKKKKPKEKPKKRVAHGNCTWELLRDENGYMDIVIHTMKQFEPWEPKEE